MFLDVKTILIRTNFLKWCLVLLFWKYVSIFGAVEKGNTFQTVSYSRCLIVDYWFGNKSPVGDLELNNCLLESQAKPRNEWNIFGENL